MGITAKIGAAERDRILQAFKGRIPSVPVPLHYRLGLFIAAVAMVLLPLIYMAMTGVAGYGIYLYADWYLSVDSPVVGRGKSIWHVAMIMAGVISVFFMLKPLLARESHTHNSRKFIPDVDPLMFSFVQKVCEAVGAPIPKEIHVNCDVNASAGFGHGIAGLFSNHLILTIGLPLVAGLSVTQLAGVLAHEMGHFSQQAGMRMTYVIRSVNLWFARVVFERDAWDEMLVRYLNVRPLMPILWPARLMIWISRLFLYVLMIVGHGISCYLARQMEYDADRYGALLVGLEEYQGIAERVRNLSIAEYAAQGDLAQFWDDGRLPDDLPSLIVANVDQLPKEALVSYQRMIRSKRTAIFDTHPSDLDRAASLERLDAPGIFIPEPPPPPPPEPAPKPEPLPKPTSKPLDSKGHSDFNPFGPAKSSSDLKTKAKTNSTNPFAFGDPFKATPTVPSKPEPSPAASPPSKAEKRVSQPGAKGLVCDYGQMAKSISLEFYQAVIGKKVKLAHLVPVVELLKRQEKDVEGMQALWRFFQGKLVDSRPFNLAEEALTAHADTGNATQVIRASRDEMLKAVPFYAFARKKYIAAEEKLTQLRQVEILGDLGIPIADASLGLDGDPANVKRAVGTQKDVLDTQNPKLKVFEDAARRRLVMALCMLQSSAMEGRLENVKELREEVASFWATLGMLESLLPEVAELSDRFSELTVLIPIYQENPEAEELMAKIRSQSDYLHFQLERLVEKMGDEPYPFDHLQGEITLAKFAISIIPPRINIDATMQASSEVYGKIQPLYYRLLAVLTGAAEKVESALGLSKLDVPAEGKLPS